MYRGDQIIKQALGIVLIVGLSLSSGLAYTTERIVLVIIDGLRYSEGLGDPNHLQVPNMAALAEQGALVTNFQNDGTTYTSRAIPAIWCGAWTEINTFSDTSCGGSSNNTTELPTVFEYYRNQLDRPAEDCVYTLKELCPWKASLDQDYGPDFWPLYHAVGYSDEDVWQETEQVIANLSPHFLLMYLADVDHAGHSGNWAEYIQAISIADSLVGELWATLQADQEYAGKTTMLITNDHGRHSYNFSGHGDDCIGCRHIQLLAIGPDIHAGLTSEIPRTIPDITPTIGELLGFTAEDATGTPMLELIDQTAGNEDEQRDTGPVNFSIKQLYPNPFNARLNILYEVLDPVPMEVHIYNMKGESVWSRYLAKNERGERKITWNANDQFGKTVTSGVYVVHFSNQTHSQSEKILLIK